MFSKKNVIESVNIDADHERLTELTISVSFLMQQ